MGSRSASGPRCPPISGKIGPLVDLLTEANFGNVFIKIESPDEAVLVGNRKYQNLKTPLGQSLTNISANGLGVVPSFIMGFDQETEGAGDRICAFVEMNNLPTAMLNLLQALPNTSLWDRLQQENRLTATGVSADMIDASFNFLPTRPAEEIAARVHSDGGLPVRAHQISGPDLPVLSGHEADSRRRREK